MEASAQVDCDLNEEDEDLDDFLKSVKVHDRFGGNYDEEDEFFSGDEPDEPIACRKGGCAKMDGGFSRSVRNSETKTGTVSMLDDARSLCSKSGPNLSLEMLNLKSDEAGLGNFEGVLLGKSILRSDPPFGDPLSEFAILDSALNLLDDKMCQKFQERGLFDGLVDKNAISIESETKTEEKDVVCVDAVLDLVTSCDRQTPKPYRKVCDLPENLGKPLCELIHEDVSQLDDQPSVKPGPLQSCQLNKPRQSKSANSSRKQLNDSNSLDSKGSVGREFPPNNLSLDDLVRYINGESLTKVCSKKANAASGTLPHTNANTKKSKKQPIKKSDVSATSKARIPLPASRLPKTTTKPSHVGVVRTEDITEGSSSPLAVCDDAVVKATRSTTTTEMTASVKEAISASDAEHEDDDAGQEEFVAVLHKKRMKTRKEPFSNPDVNSACVVPPRTKFGGYQPERSSAQTEKDPGASATSVFSIGSKSYRTDASGGSVASKRGSLSSLDESPPATYETSSLRASPPSNEGQAEVPFARPSFSKFSTGSSYASVLLQNLPKLSVTASQIEPKGVVEIGTSSSPLNSEAENEMFLSPPQSEADTGFSSSSSLSPDESQISLTSDSDVVMSKRNQVADSDPRSQPLEESSCLKHTADVGNENFEEPVEELVHDSVSRHISSLDFPMNRILELSARTDQVLQNTGETSLDCGSHSLSCVTTQSKKSPVFFDTRISTVTCTKSNSDIVFVFDHEDSGADAMSNVGSYVPVDDIVGITFMNSSDSLPFETGSLETVSNQYAAVDVEAPLDMKTSVQAGCVEETQLAQRPGRQVDNDRANCEKDIPQPDSAFADPVVGGKLVESSVIEAACSAPRSRFDLLAAQKFLSRAFKNVLKLERECPGQVVRL